LTEKLSLQKPYRQQIDTAAMCQEVYRFFLLRRPMGGWNCVAPRFFPIIYKKA